MLAGNASQGIHMGIRLGVLTTITGDTAPTDLLGRILGFFNLISDLAVLIASITAVLL